MSHSPPSSPDTLLRRTSEAGESVPSSQEYLSPLPEAECWQEPFSLLCPTSIDLPLPWEVATD